MEVVLIPRALISHINIKEGFNPCFNGSGSNTWNLGNIREISLRVSILVLMEVVLIRVFYYIISNVDIVSILVLMEVVLIHLQAYTFNYYKCVSILVLMEVVLILKNF